MANTCVIKRDAENKRLVLEVVDAAGAVVATAGRIVMDLSDVDDAPSGYREAKFREFIFQNADADCADWHCWILMTEPQPVTP